jgi:hypothetical protein
MLAIVLREAPHGAGILDSGGAGRFLWRASIMTGCGEQAEAIATAVEEGIQPSEACPTSQKHSHQLETDVGKVQCLGDIGQINGSVHGLRCGELKKRKPACEVGVDSSDGRALALRGLVLC